MRKSIFALLALVISLFGNPVLGADLRRPRAAALPTKHNKTHSVPGTTTNTYDFLWYW